MYIIGTTRTKSLSSWEHTHRVKFRCTVTAPLTQKEQVPIYSTWSSSPGELLLLGSAPGPNLAPYAPSFTNRSSFAERLHGAAATHPEPRSPGRARRLFPSCRGSSLHIRVLLLNARARDALGTEEKSVSN